jgi:hypothetical protein
MNGIEETVETIEFRGFAKISRLTRECVITEKIDGTNGCIYIAEECKPIELKSGRIVPFLVGSRSRWIYPENDNHGFARWAYENKDELLRLGPGQHFGEWWGLGIQRGYNMKEKVFSLFNVAKWTDDVRPKCCRVVPVLHEAIFDTNSCNACLDELRINGSKASPGFMKPEGIVIFHKAGNLMFKKTIEKDEEGKHSARV